MNAANLEPPGDVTGRLEREAKEDAGEIERPYAGIHERDQPGLRPG